MFDVILDPLMQLLLPVWELSDNVKAQTSVKAALGMMAITASIWPKHGMKWSWVPGCAGGIVCFLTLGGLLMKFTDLDFNVAMSSLSTWLIACIFCFSFAGYACRVDNRQPVPGE